jgi:hypothetical protein
VSLRHDIEKHFGLPKLEDVASVLKGVPDKETLGLCVKLMEKAPDKETIKELNLFMKNVEKVLKKSDLDLNLIFKLFEVIKDVRFTEINETLDKLLKLCEEGKKIGLEDLLKAMAKGEE